MVTPAAPDQAERNRIAYEANRAEHEAGEQFECSSPSCGAGLGEPCRTRDGSVTQHPHRSRQLLSGYKPGAAPVVRAAPPVRATGARDVFRQALDLRDRQRQSPTDILVGAAVENALSKFDTSELQAIVTAATELNAPREMTAATTVPANQTSLDDAPPF